MADARNQHKFRCTLIFDGDIKLDIDSEGVKIYLKVNRNHGYRCKISHSHDGQCEVDSLLGYSVM
jgi:hypothetical protein